MAVSPNNQMNVAGPIRENDIVLRASEIGETIPGIASLAMKQGRKGARQGIHRRSDKLLLLFKDDQLKEVWRLKDDRFVEYVIEYRNGNINRIKVFLIRHESNFGSGIALTNFSDNLQFG